jgi:hypothetical protein
VHLIDKGHHRSIGAACHFPLAALLPPESMHARSLAGENGAEKGSLRDKKLSINEIVI